MSVSASSSSTRSDFILNEGVRIHFYVSGQGSLMVLLHGFPDNSRTWTNQVAEFSKTHTVVCPTLRGYPPSDIPTIEENAYHLPTVVGNILAILDHFNTIKAIVGGHDFGGATIQLLALLDPERVSGLIIMNSPILPRFYELIHLDKGQQEQSAYTIHHIQYRKGDDKNLAVVLDGIKDDEHRQNMYDYLSESPMEGMYAYYRYNYPDHPYGQHVDTSGMKMPMLIIWGLADPYFSLKMLDGIPKYFENTVRLIALSGAGHWLFREQPNRINQEIRSWLQVLGGHK
ncbi:hypothetical protein CSAL01_12542 [Colletotrichum salicis]|uniref:AB hydrolase-1 domain-containing protein n=1 Tax=Colletotrichum salicis TaxID=1209931 RepID=A0A135VAP9_9PEZI|nr:hypothetical protein CSAL01_12542 [Colletotrichum salicis]